MAQPHICKKNDLSNKKSLRVRAISKNFKINVSGRDGSGDEANAFFTVSRPRTASMFVYKESTSIEKINVLSGTVRFFNLLTNVYVSLR